MEGKPSLDSSSYATRHTGCHKCYWTNNTEVALHNHDNYSVSSSHPSRVSSIEVEWVGGGGGGGGSLLQVLNFPHLPPIEASILYFSQLSEDITFMKYNVYVRERLCEEREGECVRRQCLCVTRVSVSLCKERVCVRRECV